MRALLFNYIHDESALAPLLGLDFPLADGTTQQHIALVTALHRKNTLIIDPNDKLAQQIIAIHKLIHIDENEDASDSLSVYQSALEGIESITVQESHHFRLKALALSHIAYLHSTSDSARSLDYCHQALKEFRKVTHLRKQDYVTLANTYDCIKEFFYDAEIEYRFCFIASLCLQKLTTEENNLLAQHFRAFVATLLEGSLAPGLQYRYALFTISLMEFLSHAYERNALPKNIIKQWLTGEKNQFDDALNRLKTINIPKLTDLLVAKQDKSLQKQLIELDTRLATQSKTLSDLKNTIPNVSSSVLDDNNLRLNGFHHINLANNEVNDKKKLSYQLSAVNTFLQITKRTEQDNEALRKTCIAILRLNHLKPIPAINPCKLAHQLSMLIISMLLQIDELTNPDHALLIVAAKYTYGVHAPNSAERHFWEIAITCFDLTSPNNGNEIIQNIKKLLTHVKSNTSWTALKIPLADLISLLLKACKHPEVSTHLNANKQYYTEEVKQLLESPCASFSVNEPPAWVSALTILDELSIQMENQEREINEIVSSTTRKPPTFTFFQPSTTNHKRNPDINSDELAQENQRQNKKPRTITH